MIRPRFDGGFKIASALAGALITAAFLFLLLSSSPLASLKAFFLQPFGTRFAFGNMINSATGLMFTGLGITLCFRAGIFNLGGEGQTYAGAFTAAWVGIRLRAILPGSGATGMIGSNATAAGVAGGWLLLIVAAGLLAGALLAAVSVLLNRLAGIDELLSTFLVANAVIPIMDHAVTGPFRDTESYLLTTPRIPAACRLPEILPPSHLNISLIVAVVLAVLAGVYLYRSGWGYEHRMFGLNREFAKFGGIRLGVYASVPLIVGGALCGAAGAFVVVGTSHACVQGMTAGMGWNGIAVALIARTNPFAVIPAALIFAYLEAGADAAMLHADFSFEAGAFIQAIIFLLITAERFGFKNGRRGTIGRQLRERRLRTRHVGAR